ncbi:hypothetical protein BKA82DRAFT_4017014 [Pisolithus tinctorius]|nr:hypothetical protein BKA82DRAFT_4017014 [Pisolithus tinctorius]
MPALSRDRKTNPFWNPRLYSGAGIVRAARGRRGTTVGVRHGLELINILNDDGTLNAHAGETFQVRSTVHHYTPLVSTSGSESGDNIEPILKPQWWVNYIPLAEEAIKVQDSQAHDNRRASSTETHRVRFVSSNVLGGLPSLTNGNDVDVIALRDVESEVDIGG